MAANQLFRNPNFSSPLVDKMGLCAKDWFLFFASLVNPQPESAVIPSASPFAFTATQGGSLLVVGGTVSAISVQRNQSYLTGLTAGFIPLSTGDIATITYTVAPT